MGEYIIIYVLTLSVCWTPEGKTACETITDSTSFLTAQDCVDARYNAFIRYEAQPRVIINKSKTQCEAIVVSLNDLHTFDDVSKAKQVDDESLQLAYEVNSLISNPDAWPEDTLFRLIERWEKLQNQ